MFKGFRDFILRGNVIDLAVAVVIGAAFGAVVTAIVEGGAPNFDFLDTVSFKWGTILGTIITFLITASVIYFLIIVPMNRLMARFQPSAPAPQKTRPCPECLSDIPLAARRCAFCTAEVTPAAAR